MVTIDQLIPVLKRLRLSGVMHTLDLREEQAREDSQQHREFMYRLLCDEIERRDSKNIATRVKQAGFPGQKVLEEFEFTFNPEIPKARIIDLATCQFIRRAENVLLIGPSGVGKSHIGLALGHRACRAGFRVLYRTADVLLAELRAAEADRSRDRLLTKLSNHDLLIIDDLGLTPLKGEEPINLYELIRARYEKSATIITSNRDIPEWAGLFRDPLLASAAIDRLLHHAHVITLTGKSYRTQR